MKPFRKFLFSGVFVVLAFVLAHSAQAAWIWEKDNWEIKVNIRNNCHRPIWIAVHYMLNGSWRTGGYWKLSLGEKAYVVDTDNLFIYFHAESDKSHAWGG